MTILSVLVPRSYKHLSKHVLKREEMPFRAASHTRNGENVFLDFLPNKSSSSAASKMPDAFSAFAACKPLKFYNLHHF